MQGVRLNIKGNWAQFRRSETNNNPLTHDFITKTALIGMMGAVLGINREEMKMLFPVLCDDLKYGVWVKNEVKKQSWGFTFRSIKNAWEKVPKQMELLCNPEYEVVLCLVNERSQELFARFVSYCKDGKACYEPVLGLHNCPATIEWIENGELTYFPKGVFETNGFVTSRHVPENMEGVSRRIGFDRIPCFQNEDFWNLPDRFEPVIYAPGDLPMQVSGEYYAFNNQSMWCLL